MDPYAIFGIAIVVVVIMFFVAKEHKRRVNEKKEFEEWKKSRPSEKKVFIADSVKSMKLYQLLEDKKDVGNQLRNALFWAEVKLLLPEIFEYRDLGNEVTEDEKVEGYERVYNDIDFIDRETNVISKNLTDRLQFTVKKTWVNTWKNFNRFKQNKDASV